MGMGKTGKRLLEAAARMGLFSDLGVDDALAG
jgi:hypothetical protein